MAGAFVNGTTNQITSAGTTMNTAVTATANNLLVAIVSTRIETTSMTASGWTKREFNEGASVGADFFERIATGTSSDDLNLTWTVSAFASVCIGEYSGLDTTAPFETSGEDVTNINTGANQSQATGSATPGSADGMAIAALAFKEDWDSPGTISIDNSFVIDVSETGANSRPGTRLASLVYTTTAAQSATFSTTDIGNPSYGCMHVYKEPGDGGVTPEYIHVHAQRLIRKR